MKNAMKDMLEDRIGLSPKLITIFIREMPLN